MSPFCNNMCVKFFMALILLFVCRLLFVVCGLWLLRKLVVFFFFLEFEIFSNDPFPTREILQIKHFTNFKPTLNKHLPFGEKERGCSSKKNGTCLACPLNRNLRCLFVFNYVSVWIGIFLLKQYCPFLCCQNSHPHITKSHLYIRIFRL